MQREYSPEELEYRKKYGILSRDEREHLNKLSLELMGTKSKWHKFYTKGEKIDTMIKFKSGVEVKGRTTYYPTIEEIKNILESKAKNKATAKENNIDGTATVKLEGNADGSVSDSPGTEGSQQS